MANFVDNDAGNYPVAPNSAKMSGPKHFSVFGTKPKVNLNLLWWDRFFYLFQKLVYATGADRVIRYFDQKEPKLMPKLPTLVPNVVFCDKKCCFWPVFI